MPAPTPGTAVVVALLSVAPEAGPTKPSAKLSAAPTSQSYPAEVIDVVKIDDQVRVQLRGTTDRPKVLLTMEKVELSYPEVKVSSPKGTALKASPKMTSLATAKIEATADKATPKIMTVTAKVEGSGAKIELLANKIEGERVLSIGCDGVVTDGSATWRLEGPSAFALPDGTQIHLQPGGKGGKNVCASVDITSGNQHVHLVSRGSTVVIDKAAKSAPAGLKITETGQRIDTGHKHAAGHYFIKLAPAAHKIDGSVPGWAVLENVDGEIKATGLVFKSKDGVSETFYKVELENVLVTSYSTGG